ncbi:MAG: right-handed parallel beta-helix repeat-containing protein [Planctomycetota bacterium]
MARSLLEIAAVILLAAPSLESREVYVDATVGNDATGNGSAAAPYRTLAHALEAAAAGPLPATFRLAAGRHDQALGERFPLTLPAGSHLEGAGGGKTIFSGSAGAVLLRAAPGVASSGPVVLRSLSFEKARSALLIEAGPEERCACAIEQVEITACEEGIVVGGDGEIELALTASKLSGGAVGLRLIPTASPSQPLTRHRVTASGCVFERHSSAGILREGPEGSLAATTPYRVTDCLFAENEYGLHFTRPAGETPLEVRGCRFIGNRSVGARLAGQRGDPVQHTLFEACSFERNGTGLYLTNLEITNLVDRCAFSENVGNGLVAGCFAGRPGHTRVTNSLFAKNGASGLFAVSDGGLLAVRIVNCTFAANGTAGLFTKLRHGGRQEHGVQNSIFWTNGTDLLGLPPERVDKCLVQSETLASDGRNIRSDPLFEDAAAGNYRLRAGSPAIDRGALPTSEPALATDLEGRPRIQDGDGDGTACSDLGAYERM